MFSKTYWVESIHEDADGNTTVHIEYVAKQSGSTPSTTLPTGLTGTCTVATPDDLDADGDGYKHVTFTCTGAVTVNSGYLKDEFYFTRN